jgi:hypothetical protein
MEQISRYWKIDKASRKAPGLDEEVWYCIH